MNWVIRCSVCGEVIIYPKLHYDDCPHCNVCGSSAWWEIQPYGLLRVYEEESICQ